MEFKPSANAEGSTELDLTIQVGTQESTPEGEILTSEEVETKEIEILEDLNNDGTTGVDLSQEVFNPNASSPNNTHNNSTSRFAYTDENGGLILTRNAVNGLNLNSVGASDTGEIRHHGPDVARLSTPSGNSFTIPAGSEPLED